MKFRYKFISAFAAFVFAVAAVNLFPTQTESEPLARLFQILFILFIVSPPLIALMLFLIWKEIKARNEKK